MKILLTEDGLLLKDTSKEVDIVADKQPETGEEALKLLRKPWGVDCEVEWEIFIAAWKKTLFSRRELSKKSPIGAFWQWESLPCVSKNRDLILLDFEKYYESSTNIEDTWPPFRNALMKFISTRRLDDELQELFNDIDSLTNEQKDAVLITIFPSAILAPIKPISNRKSAKRAKINTDEEKQIRLAGRETFVSIVPDDEKVNSFVYEKLQKADQGPGPYVIIVGTFKELKNIYLIIRTVKYCCKTIPEAFDLAVKTYLTYHIPYPAKSCHAWIIVQKLILRINKPDDKLLQVTKKALSFFMNELKIPYE